MINTDGFAVIGGDARQLAMAESIFADGYNVYMVGFENIELKTGLISFSLDDALKKTELVLLPVPAMGIDGHLNAPYSSAKINLDDNFARKMYEKKVFCGVPEKLIATSEIWKNINLNDYSKRDDFAISNAVPTAEGAMGIAMFEYKGTIHGARCLVSGFGRVGKAVCKALNSLGAKVTASARKPADLAWIKTLGYESISTGDIAANIDFDIIFNTIPDLIFDEKTLTKLKPDTIIIDLASLPGGVDFEAAKKLGLNAIQALGLPGKVAPKTAGEIIKNTVYNMIEEG